MAIRDPVLLQDQKRWFNEVRSRPRGRRSVRIERQCALSVAAESRRHEGGAVQARQPAGPRLHRPLIGGSWVATNDPSGTLVRVAAWRTAVQSCSNFGFAHQAGVQLAAPAPGDQKITPVQLRRNHDVRAASVTQFAALQPRTTSSRYPRPLTVWINGASHPSSILARSRPM